MTCLRHKPHHPLVPEQLVRLAIDSDSATDGAIGCLASQRRHQRCFACSTTCFVYIYSMHEDLCFHKVILAVMTKATHARPRKLYH